MGFDELMQELKDGTLIKCETPEERLAFLRYMVDKGFKLGDCTQKYLKGRTDFSFPYPGLHKQMNEIHCWSADVFGKRMLPYADIEHLILGTETICELPDLSGLFE